MQILKLSEYEKLNDLYLIWNAEYGNIYPITAELFERNIENIYMKASYVAVDDGKLIGFVIGKVWQDDYNIKTYEKIGWISLIYVKKEFRNNGIGTLLLQKSLDVFKSLGCTKVFLGKDYQNFFPGLPVDLKAHVKWFTNRV